jgi:hypothetical protein
MSMGKDYLEFTGGAGRSKDPLGGHDPVPSSVRSRWGCVLSGTMSMAVGFFQHRS